MKIRKQLIFSICVFVLFSSCGYKVLNVNESLKNYSIRLGKVKNLTTEYGTEQELVKVLHKTFLSNGIKIQPSSEHTEFELNSTLKSIQFLPLTYTKGINTAYTYQYEVRITVDAEFLSVADNSKRKSFSISESDYYFSQDSPATTEANKRLAIIKVLSKITERLIREMTIGI
ncbi:MAG: LPS assembly lipoprotein LptE [Deltaproteobacteria bacterium]|nr:LPS assembly lipoprotein LptE [Deltaproteobacteria bacterium]